MNVNYTVINQTLSIKKKLGLTYFWKLTKQFMQKTLDVIFKPEKENKNILDIIVCMSGFHIIISLLRTIYGCLEIQE